jgi:hypothetical protein
MRDQYNYIDPDYVYTDPKTGILRNSQNITDYKVLQSFESISATTRLGELKDKPITIIDGKRGNSLVLPKKPALSLSIPYSVKAGITPMSLQPDFSSTTVTDT